MLQVQVRRDGQTDTICIIVHVQVKRDRQTDESCSFCSLLISRGPLCHKWCPRGCEMAYLARDTRA